MEVFTGVTISEINLKTHFVIMFIGVNLTFFPQHFLGLQGIPRRYSDYPDAMTTWNIVRSSGRLIRIAGALMFSGMMWTALKEQPRRADAAGARVEFSPRIPTTWHTYNETTMIA